jgi:hypothetical protein
VIYASNFSADRITVFEPRARGNAAPVRTIEGGRTGLAGPRGLALDARGCLYVANRRAATVTVYAPAASGNVAPLRTLHAPAVRSVEGLALGPDGGVFVSSCPGGDLAGPATIAHFVADDMQCDYTIAGSKTGLTYPVGLALAHDGTCSRRMHSVASSAPMPPAREAMSRRCGPSRRRPRTRRASPATRTPCS